MIRKDWLLPLLIAIPFLPPNPIRKTRSGWWWGKSHGPFPTREKALQVMRAVFAHGYRGNPADLEERLPWQKTQRVYIRDYAGIVPASQAIARHRLSIKSALERGKIVPPEVLADYPDLAAGYTRNPIPIRVGDRVEIYEKSLTPATRYYYGTGTVVEIGSYPSHIKCYFVKSDRIGKVWDYEYSQLRKIKLNPVDLYQAFHGNPPMRTRVVNLPVPKKGQKLVKIGRLTHVIYSPEWPSRHSGSHYEHEFGDTGTRMLKEKPILACTEDGKSLYIIPDKANPRFTKRGIIA